MIPFVDLQRRFHHLTANELEEPDILAYFSESEFGSGFGWDTLLEYARVVLIAEAGAGKTVEMSRQAKCLVEDGKHGFFVALESLTSSSLIDLLSPDEEHLFYDWKSNGHTPAWFFLDAVDELKLKQGRLERALLRLSRELHGHLDRARIIISCRPSDWCQSVDMPTVQQRLPLLITRENKLSRDPYESFLEVLRKQDRHVVAFAQNGRSEEDDALAVKTVVLLPLGRRQIEIYAQQSGVTNPAAFLAELDRQNAWTFARRPLDINDLITVWTCENRLGTRSEQHETNIQAKLKDRPDRPDSGILTEIQAREGAERLALALTLTRNLTIRSLDQSIDPQRSRGVLDSAKILMDWTELERQTLLRRALFDPATYGRIRFHHRSVQEYLAAKRLLWLREQGMTTKALSRLLFAERYGVQVAVPSMRAIAAWLSLWDENIRRDLTRYEPEALLSFGDPEALSFAARTDLLREFATTYGQGGWRGIDIPIDEVRRLAHPSLAPLIHALWDEGPTNDDVRQLLIELIWQGRIKECANLARAAALNTAWTDHQRITAIKALLECNEVITIKEIAADIITQPSSWPDRIVHHISPYIFPSIITVDELIDLIERTPESEFATGGFEWALCQIAQSIEPWSNVAVTLRDRVADLIWQGRFNDQDPYDIHSKFDHLKPGLAYLCEKHACDQLKITPELIRACIIANRFGGQADSHNESVTEIKKGISNIEVLRSQIFWAELALVDEVSTVNNDYERLDRAEHGGLLGYLTPADRSWLLIALEDESRPERRSVALLALLQFWQHGRDPSEIEKLRKALRGDAVLEAIFVNKTAPLKPDKELERLNREHLQRVHEREAKDEKRLKDWERWREEVLADPVGCFSEEKQENTVVNLHRWLMTLYKNRHNYMVWSKDAISKSFSLDVAERAEKAFRSCWRSIIPVLWSKRQHEERNVVLYSWLRGLCGLYAETYYPEWMTSITPEEAKIATAYAAIEMNGFAPFIDELTKTYPIEVNSVLGEELEAEFKVCTDYDHLPILQHLVYATNDVKHLLGPRLILIVKAIPSVISNETGQRLSRHIDHVFSILKETIHGTSRRELSLECAKRYHANSKSPLAESWLKGIFYFDVELGVQTLIDYLSTCKSHENHEHVIKTFATLFGERDCINLNAIAPSRRAHYLCQLVRNAYFFIRREEDQNHLGAYTPNFRDEAQTARNFLLSALFETPGPEAYSAIFQLATEPDFAHFQDRLRQHARERAAKDAEPPAYRSEDLVFLDHRYEMPPRDMESLFSVMMDRLDDLQHDISHHDFSDRRTLRTISEEDEMQRTLAFRININSKRAFSVGREDEVADRKRTDIRLTTTSGNKAVIEVKLADKRWSLTDLERALNHQLVGQYLRHETCKTGCLLLTYDGQKKHWVHPLTKKYLKFSEMVRYLDKKAKELEKDHNMKIRLAVFGLDLTDPKLEPAHREGRLDR